MCVFIKTHCTLFVLLHNNTNFEILKLIYVDSQFLTIIKILKFKSDIAMKHYEEKSVNSFIFRRVLNKDLKFFETLAI